MEQTVEEIERQIREGPGRNVSDRSGPYDTRPDPDWWEDYYGEDIEP